KLGIKDDEFVMLFVGSGWERKGLNFLLRAVEQLNLMANEPAEETEDSTPLPRAIKHVRLLVVGKGRKPRGAPDNVLFAGPMSNVEDAYAAADLFTFVPIYEPSSNVVYEALAAGLPVITSSFNGAGEVLQPGVNGTVVKDPSDIGAIIEAILYWMAHRFSVPRTDTAALSLERNVAETLRVLELAAAERKKRL
ncbi:MAG TPA: glycosyltransferase family 4 protein, partial [Roseimicrobium sp.]|nr:glycosyltransferase family 4 protein [Roseimicrobium sp.]